MNAIFNLPTILKTVLLACLFAVLWFITQQQQAVDDETLVDPSARSIDYAMTDFTMTVMDEAGIPSRIIAGEQLNHYPDDDSTEIFMAKSHFLEPEKDTWIVTSNEAYTQGKADVIDLEGNVIITRESDNEMQLLTEQLTVDNANEIAYTDLPVTIISPYGDTDAVGLHASLRDRTINLHSKVKGQYDAPPID